ATSSHRLFCSNNRPQEELEHWSARCAHSPQSVGGGALPLRDRSSFSSRPRHRDHSPGVGPERPSHTHPTVSMGHATTETPKDRRPSTRACRKEAPGVLTGCSLSHPSGENPSHDFGITLP